MTHFSAKGTIHGNKHSSSRIFKGLCEHAVCVILPVITFETLWPKPTKCKGTERLLRWFSSYRSVKIGNCEEKGAATGQDAMLQNELSHCWTLETSHQRKHLPKPREKLLISQLSTHFAPLSANVHRTAWWLNGVPKQVKEHITTHILVCHILQLS